MLLLGILAATWLTGVRWTRRGGDWDLVFRVAMWGVAGGIVGARLYHVVTSWSEVPDPKWQGVFEIWKGGLGIWGAIAGGVIAGAIVVRRSGNSIYRFMDVAAPGILLAQAIGRWGNYFNQELFGKPTDASLGPRDRRPEPAREVHRRADLPPALPLRVALEFSRSRVPASRRPALQDPAAGPLRPLRRLVHGVSHLRGDPAHRPVARVLRAAAELLCLRDRVRARDRGVRLVAAPDRDLGATAAHCSAAGAEDDGAERPRPPLKIRLAP